MPLRSLVLVTLSSGRFTSFLHTWLAVRSSCFVLKLVWLQSQKSVIMKIFRDFHGWHGVLFHHSYRKKLKEFNETIFKNRTLIVFSGFEKEVLKSNFPIEKGQIGHMSTFETKLHILISNNLKNICIISFYKRATPIISRGTRKWDIFSFSMHS